MNKQFRNRKTQELFEVLFTCLKPTQKKDAKMFVIYRNVESLIIWCKSKKQFDKEFYDVSRPEILSDYAETSRVAEHSNKERLSRSPIFYKSSNTELKDE